MARTRSPQEAFAGQRDPNFARSDAKTVKAVVLADGYAYHEVSGDPRTPRVDVAAPAGTGSAKGVVIEVSQAEFDRGAKMEPPALAHAGSREAKTALAEPVEDVVQARYAGLTDADLAAVVTARGEDAKGKSRDELLAILT